MASFLTFFTESNALGAKDWSGTFIFLRRAVRKLARASDGPKRAK